MRHFKEEHCEREENTPLNVPPIVAEYLEAESAKDARRLSLCFGENGVVHDEGKDRLGRYAIRQRKEEVDAKYRYVSEPLAVSVLENTVTVRARLTGFTLEDGKIVSLEIDS